MKICPFVWHEYTDGVIIAVPKGFLNSRPSWWLKFLVGKRINNAATIVLAAAERN